MRDLAFFPDNALKGQRTLPQTKLNKQIPSFQFALLVFSEFTLCAFRQLCSSLQLLHLQQQNPLTTSNVLWPEPLFLFLRHKVLLHSARPSLLPTSMAVCRRLVAVWSALAKRRVVQQMPSLSSRMGVPSATPSSAQTRSRVFTAKVLALSRMSGGPKSARVSHYILFPYEETDIYDRFFRCTVTKG